MADFTKDDWDSAQLHVQDAVAETGVQCDQEADGRAEELDGAEEEFFGEVTRRDVPFFVFRM